MATLAKSSGEIESSIAESGLFDPEYYAVEAGVSPGDALAHYGSNSDRLDLNPHPLFDSLFYAFSCSDFVPGEVPGLLHFLRSGAVRGRSPHPLFDGNFYRRQFRFTDRVPDNPLRHYLENALGELDLDPHPLFDSSFYLDQIPSLQESGENPLLHYVRTGGLAAEPNRFFDTAYYLSQFPLGVPERTPLEHWVVSGHSKPHRDPNRLFVTSYFCQNNPEVAQRGINPLEYYLNWGRRSGRLVAYQITDMLIKAAGISSGRMSPCEFRRRRTGIFLYGGIGKELSPRLLDQLNADWRESEMFLFLPSKDVNKLPAPWRSRAFRLEYFFLDQGSCAELATLLAALESPHKPLILVSDQPETLGAFTEREVLTREAYEETEVPGRGIEKRDDGPGSRRSGSGKRGTVIIPIYDWNLSGVNRVNEILAVALKARGWTVEFLVTNRFFFHDGFPGEMPEIPIRFLDAPHSWSDLWWAQARDLVESLAPAVMVTGYDFRASALAAAVSDRIAVISVFHSDDPDYFVQAENLGRYFDQIVTVSEYLRAELAQKNPEIASRIIAIPNGVEDPGANLLSMPASEEGIGLIYAGRVVNYQKRVFDLVPLVEELEHRGVAYRLTIAGDGEDRVELERRLRRQVENGNVLFTGRISKEQIGEYLARNQVFVLLSDFEGLPVSLIEAIGQGCVPVAPDIASGVPEIVIDEETGYVIPRHDLSLYADRIQQLQREPETWARLSKNGRALFERQFTADKFADRYEALIQSLLDKIDSGELAEIRSDSQPSRSLWVGREWSGFPAG